MALTLRNIIILPNNKTKYLYKQQTMYGHEQTI